MGLFGGKSKKICPICGNPSAWFLPTKIEGQPLCNDCAVKDMPLPAGHKFGDMTMAEALEYLAFYDGTQPALRETFQETYRYNFSFGSDVPCLDTTHRLLKLDMADSSFVMGPENIRRFRILEDDAPLFEGTEDELICYQSAVPDRVRGLGPEIHQLTLDRERYEQMKRMEEELERQAKARGETYYHNYVSAPDINLLRPFQKFRLEIEVDHPYSADRAEYQKKGPSFTDYYSSAIKDYLHDYEEAVAEMRGLAEQLMAVLNPDAPVRQVSTPASPGQAAPAASAAPADPVAEIQKYKTLLDSGAITEEEFAAKKKQLLGL